MFVLIFLLPFIGLLCGILVKNMLPHKKISYVELMPPFLIAACQLITSFHKLPSFLPYAFLFYLILVVTVAINFVKKEKNIALGRILFSLWRYLILCSFIWYICLLLITIFL